MKIKRKSSAFIGIILAINLIPSIALADSKVESNTNSDLPVVNTQDWREGKFGKIDWSEVVMIKDDFDGNYIAVLDRKHNGGLLRSIKQGVVSEWSKKKIKVHYYSKMKPMIGKGYMQVAPIETMILKVGEDIFELTGKNGTFVVTNEIKKALSDAKGDEPKMKITIKKNEAMLAHDVGEMIVEIGEETIEAWKTVYQ